MRKCLKCEDSVPARIRVDGKLKNLQNRKYCLKCSPFGSHNTRRIHEDIKKHKQCICSMCNRLYTYTREYGHTMSACNSCLQKKRRHEKKLELIKIAGGKCEVCGYSKCLKALEFHHVDESKKCFGLTETNLHLSWKKILKELKKCILICCRCHREIHDGLIDL